VQPHASREAWSSLVASIDGPQSREGAGTGTGMGTGMGMGMGTGMDIGAGIAPPPRDVPATPPPPSRRRAPRLIFPSRQTDAQSDRVFVAHITVDSDGSVVGVRMLSSHPGRAAQTAEDAVWTFRYAPALDDDGQPVRATVDQEFQVR
jgi:hypothetical protein